MGKIGNIVSATKIFLNLLGGKFCFPNNISLGGGPTGNMDRKQIVSATMFTNLPGL